MASNTVTVACKLPHGLRLRLHDMVDVSEAMAGGGSRKVQRAQVRGESVLIKGYLEKYDPKLPPAARGSSFALTHGVDKDFWDAWVKQNSTLDAVKNGLIFASDKADTVEAMVREGRDLRSGLEPVDPSNLPKGIATYSREAA